jgi:tetratricopeptide (TPR) repeat protein
VARVKAIATSTPEPMQRVLLLVDTSASRALGFTAQVGLVREVLSKLDAAVQVTVAAFDQDVQVVHEGPASGFGEPQLKALRDRRPLGASNVAAALEWALAQKSAAFPRVVLVTDGVFTAGTTEGDELLALVARLKGAGVQRLDAIAVGGIRDEAVLARLVSGALPKTGTVLDGDSGADTIVRRLQESTVPRLPVTAEDAKVVWPTMMTGVQAGDEAVVVLEVTGEKPALKLGSRRVELFTGVVGVERPLLERVWAQAKIKALLDFQDRGADGPAQKEKVRAEITGLSTRYRVLSPYTALLVLEREEDYARFHIDRRALADLLGVEGGRLVLKKRAAETIAAQKRPPAGAEPMRKMDVAPDVDERRDEASPADAEKEAPAAKPAEERPSASPAPAPGPASGVAAVPPLTPAPRPPQAEPVEQDPAPAARERAGVNMRRERSIVAAEPERSAPADRGTDDQPVSKEPWEGPFKEVMVSLREGKTERALQRAKGWREEQPGDVLALIALGEALEATKDLPRAARAYGSVIDLFPERADLRRFAGVRLERIALASALTLAIDDFGKAAEQRPDHPASHRMYAWALVKGGQYAKAFAAIEKGVQQRYPDGRFAEAGRILREDAGLIAAAWLKAEPGAAVQVKARLATLGATLEQSPSLRFVLTWETDANDVDFHIRDAKGGHAYYREMSLNSGGRLYADVTTGYGPECFTVPLTKGKRAGPYRLQAHYYSRGPMGYGLGKLQIIDHDGKGGFTFEERPFVVMVDQAFVDLGVVK